MKESEFQDAVVDVAHRFGWRVAHFRPAQTRNGWRTAVAYDGQGFPDCVMVNPDRRLTLFVEFKSAVGKLSPAQVVWRNALLEAFGKTPDVRYLLWRPGDADDIARTLSNGRITEWRLT